MGLVGNPGSPCFNNDALSLATSLKQYAIHLFDLLRIHICTAFYGVTTVLDKSHLYGSSDFSIIPKRMNSPLLFKSVCDH
jgi:hypothetical protein